MQAEKGGHPLACGLLSLTYHPTFSKFHSTQWELLTNSLLASPLKIARHACRLDSFVTASGRRDGVNVVIQAAN